MIENEYNSLDNNNETLESNINEEELIDSNVYTRYLDAAKDPRNIVLSEHELNELLPKIGYSIVTPPDDYERDYELVRVLNEYTQRKRENNDYIVPAKYEHLTTLPSVPEITIAELNLRFQDYQYFAELFEPYNKNKMNKKQQRSMRIKLLLLRIKNCTSGIRRGCRKFLLNLAKEISDCKIIMHEVLQVLQYCANDAQEEYYMLQILCTLIRIYKKKCVVYVKELYTLLTTKLLVTQRLLLDQTIFTLSSACLYIPLTYWLPIVIKDIRSDDSSTRYATVKFLGVYAKSVSILNLIIFLRALVRVNDEHQTRLIAMWTIQQIVYNMEYLILPYLKVLVQLCSVCLNVDQSKIKIAACQSIYALAKVVYPYGIEAFECVVHPLWKNLKEYRGRGFVSVLNAISAIIPLMDSTNAMLYAKETNKIIVKLFNNPDDEIKLGLLNVIRLCCKIEVLNDEFINETILEPFFTSFFTLRHSLDNQMSNSIINTVKCLAQITDSAKILKLFIPYSKDKNASLRVLCLSCIDQILNTISVPKLDSELEKCFVDACIYSIQEETKSKDDIHIKALAKVIQFIGIKLINYLEELILILRWKLNNANAEFRREGAKLFAYIVEPVKKCGVNEILVNFGMFLFEYLGEEYPNVLAAVLSALNAIFLHVGPLEFKPSVNELMLRLTPILSNRNLDVQCAVIQLIGTVSELAGSSVDTKEWDRICANLIDLLHSPHKYLRTTTAKTFGLIAQSIGPHDVIVPLLNNIKSSERHVRICTTVAIAIIADSCMPYTVIPLLMNEYKITNSNTQHGVLKALCFLFEYIGDKSNDYIYAVYTLLVSALTDSDVVHRQIAIWTVKHLALGCHGLGKDDVLLSLLNYVWPNILETAAHIRQATFDAIDGLRIGVGPAVILYYTLQGLFHASKYIRETYWRIYNCIYCGHMEQLVGAYIEFTNDITNKYSRYELYMCL